jgi:hypothetical protein
MANPHPKPPPAHTRWPKGKSGNPKGRPPKLPKLDDLLATVMTEERNGLTAAEAVLRALLVKATKGDVRAAELLLDRSFGKMRLPSDITSGGEPVRVVAPIVWTDEKAAE